MVGGVVGAAGDDKDGLPFLGAIHGRGRGRRDTRGASVSIANEDDAPEGALADLLPAADGGPEAAAMRGILLAEIEAALAELPPEQRAVFVAQELEGIGFRELAQRSGVSINTLLARKRYAVRFLRARLRKVWDDWLMT